MIRKLNQLINSSIGFSILLIILGIVLIIFPKTSLEIISYLISTLLIINGIYLIILEFGTTFRYIPLDTSLNGILSILFGIIMLIYPNMLSIIIPIILGTYFIIASIFKIKLAMHLKNIEKSPWLLTLLLAILSTICGIVLIMNPMNSSITLTLIAGVMLMIYSISDIIDMLVFKKHLNNLVKHLKKSFKIIEE